jgi:hypothetical protein
MFLGLRWHEFLIFLALFTVFSTIVAVQASRRGYRFLTWFTAGLLGNPVFFLVLLAILPDRARRALRSRERADLEARLAAKARGLPASPAAAQPSTVTAAPGVSLGDQVTVAPPVRSLGDEETRG